MKTSPVVRPRLAWLMSASVLAVSLLLAGTEDAKAAEDLIVVVPEGTAKPAALQGHVAHWKRVLGAENVVWVDSVKREQPSGFASMAVLNFADESRLAAWKEANAAALAAPLKIAQADVLTEAGVAPPATSSPVYKISYYDLTAPRDSFQSWVDGYLSKYLQAQLQHGILTRYAMYLERGQAGRALLVLEYASAKAEQEAEPIKAKLSEEIGKVDAEYARQFDLKESLRVTRSWTVAIPAR